MWVYQRMTYVVAKSMETKPNAVCTKFGVTKRRRGLHFLKSMKKPWAH